MRYILSPSILSADFSRLGEEATLAVRGGAEWLHLDVMDGMFVPNISFGAPVIRSLRAVSDAFFDVHLMIERPERYLDDFLNAGADLICVHLEATDQPEKIATRVHETGKMFALAIKPGTAVAELEPYLPLCDMVLVMSVEPGFGGQSFMAEMMEKVVWLAEKRAEGQRPLHIQVDGGVNLENLPVVARAGANVIVAGSAVFQRGKTAENAGAFIKAFSAFSTF